MKVKSKNPSEASQIKKRINTELFTDVKQGLYIQKGEKGTDQKDRIKKITDLIEEGRLKRWERKCDNENKAACME